MAFGDLFFQGFYLPGFYDLCCGNAGNAKGMGDVRRDSINGDVGSKTTSVANSRSLAIIAAKYRFHKPSGTIL